MEQFEITVFNDGNNLGYETVTGREELADRVAELLADHDKVEVTAI